MKGILIANWIILAIGILGFLNNITIAVGGTYETPMNAPAIVYGMAYCFFLIILTSRAWGQMDELAQLKKDYAEALKVK